MKIQILHRWNASILFECELSAEVETASRRIQLGFAVEAAVAARANLSRANLADAYLADAYLADADLAGADLAGADLARADLARADLADANLARANLADANLSGAYLADAYLADADLAGADLADAYLADADLAGADLAGADLARADLARANLADANLSRANLADAYLADADLAGAKNAPPDAAAQAAETPEQRRERQLKFAVEYRERNPTVPVVEQLDAKILAAVEGGGCLNMSTWHECETTHCRAGWAITLAGKEGKALEERYGPEIAGTRIYRASTGRVPNFFATKAAALADIRAQAELLAGA